MFFFIYLFEIFEIFTICFKGAISKLFERLHFEGRCYPVIVLPRVEHLLIIVFYCNTSVGHCRCSLLLASWGTSSWFTCSFGCPVRFRRYLFVILMISSSTNGILESLWRVTEFMLYCCRRVSAKCRKLRIPSFVPKYFRNICAPGRREGNFWRRFTYRKFQNLYIDVHYGPGVESASSRNEYRECFLGVRRLVRRADNLTTFMC